MAALLNLGGWNWGGRGVGDDDGGRVEADSGDFGCEVGCAKSFCNKTIIFEYLDTNMKR